MRSLTQVQDASRSVSITMSSYSEGILSMFTDYVHTGIRRFPVCVCVTGLNNIAVPTILRRQTCNHWRSAWSVLFNTVALK